VGVRLGSKKCPQSVGYARITMTLDTYSHVLRLIVPPSAPA
jgi:hypothetical protein